MATKIAVLGSGDVGKTLAGGLRDLGYEVTLASREGKAVDGWDGNTESFSQATADAEIVVLSVKGIAAESVVRDVANNLSGKLVIDTTNPISDKPLQDGVFEYFTDLHGSLMERLQDIAPEAHFVKAFNSVGSGVMVHPDFGHETPSMFICGNSPAAKETAGAIVTALGWNVEDLGTAVAARALEPLCITWCIPGFLHGDWHHAFKVLRKS